MIDLIVIGAGPSGMSAAITAVGHGLKTMLLDEQSTPGGQIYRNVLDESRDYILGEDYSDGRALVQTFLASEVNYCPGTRVWRVDEDGVCLTGPEGSELVRAQHVLLATGAMERPVPTKGWTLPGVMTAGSAQIMLKSSGIAVEDAVFVGSGPLLYLIVAQYLRAGLSIKAVLDTTPRGNYLAAIQHGVGALRGWSYISKGLKLLAEIRHAGVRILPVQSYAFTGADRLEGIEYYTTGRLSKVACGTALVHQGVIPAAQSSMSTSCTHDWSSSQASWMPRSGDAGRTDIDWLRIAGDGAGIAGAISARHSGALAALGIAQDQNNISTAEFEHLSGPIRKSLARDGAVRPFLDKLYRPRPEFLAPVNDEITICRCELVSRGAIRQAVAEGCPGPNQLKAFTRAGMGPCQGRMCGPLVTGVITNLSGESPNAVGHYNIRSPFRPVTVSEIASIG